MDEIRKSAIDSFIELDKVPRSKQSQKLEALLSRKTPAKPETTEEKDGNPSYPLPKLVFNDIYSNMFKPTMLFRNKKDGRLSNLHLNLANFDLQTQSTSISSSSITPTISSQYEGTTFLLNDKLMTSTATHTSESTSTLKPQTLERGLLDLIFPPSRVRTFKKIFNAIRRILSGTF
ncbi:uncharacterized protein LOC113228717 [Hyposmocoma kahamanoa]|uniref:uncharacterized protein LOC113228717 n=1 Tax=Hyposmocoma kahamanoa TaxID=1477025 RepID=UPI000E6D5AC0|nr:uncharacterized protein LOC113228717 [Hyposmocoma kahamanoa]